MSTTHRDKSSGKPRQRSRKMNQRDPKPEGQQDLTPVQRDEDQIASMTASTDVPTNSTAQPAAVPITGEVEPADVHSVGTFASAANYPVSFKPSQMLTGTTPGSRSRRAGSSSRS
jgi:hypothetical protein